MSGYKANTATTNGSNSMNVQLDLGAPSGSRVSIGDSLGQNSVAAASTPTTVSWTLTGQIGQAANFVPMTAAEPGFSWAYADGTPGHPPAGLFDQAVITNNGNTLSIVDHHLDATTVGQWIYILRVLCNGTVYATKFVPGTSGTVRNPVIINR